MEKSKEFILNRIRMNYTQLSGVDEYINSTEIDFTEVLNMISESSRSLYNTEENRFKFIIKDKELNKETMFEVIYNPDEAFDYFTMEECISDGTFYFGYNLMTKILEKIFKLETVNSMTVPHDFNERWYDYIIRYTVGNYVFNDITGNFGTAEKPWLHSKFTMMLPIKCVFIRKEH
jgi:hypothetical protein